MDDLTRCCDNTSTTRSVPAQRSATSHPRRGRCAESSLPKQFKRVQTVTFRIMRNTFLRVNLFPTTNATLTKII